MSAAKERLKRFLELASERRWATLTDELADFVFDWPADDPDIMRAPVLALLEAAVRQADRDTRRLLAARLGGHPELPLKLLNELYLEAPGPVRREILMRDELDAGPAGDTEAADANALLAAARRQGDFAGALSTAFCVPRRIAEHILDDASGEALAVLCRGAGIDRAVFSALALLKGAGGLPLDVFDSVPPHAAERILNHWRTHAEHRQTEIIRAAE